MRKIHTIWYEMVYKRYEIGAGKPGRAGLFARGRRCGRTSWCLSAVRGLTCVVAWAGVAPGSLKTVARVTIVSPQQGKSSRQRRLTLRVFEETRS